MRFLDLTLSTAAENLALDEALLLEAEAGRGGEVLRLWEYPRLAVVLGSGGVLADDVNEAACLADGVPLLRRSSGGGTVLLGPGCLLFSLVLALDLAPELAGIRSSYTAILSRVCVALSGVLGGPEMVGISDLAADGKKFSGNAQQRKRSHVLHHGTLLYAFDLPLLGRYLKEPPRQPEYRAGRGHAEFVCNFPCSGDELRRRFRNTWEAAEPLTEWPRAEVRQLVEEKYALEAWTRRR
jgi:lipoate-protein ligase A